jgi:hypothetical protein
MFGACLLVDPYHLRGSRRIERIDLFCRAQSLPTDHQFVLMTQHVTHARESHSHGLRIFVTTEVREGLVVEGSLRR